MSSNFAFLPPEFREIAEAASKAEGHIHGDPRSACFNARFAPEAAAHWLYRHDPALTMPYDQSLGALLHEPTFQNLLGETIFQKARLIQREGNQAVHSSRLVRQDEALQVVKELHHLCYWLTRTYFPQGSREGAGWRDERVPQAEATGETVSRSELEALEKRLATQHEEALERQKERDALDQELQTLRSHLAEVRAASEHRADSHDFSEAETRRFLIDVELRRAGWMLDAKRDRELPVIGMPKGSGNGFADYVLWGDDGKPLGVGEAKRTMADAKLGQQQAKLYADCLEAMTGQRPIIFFSNGYETWIWDDVFYPPRKVMGYYKKEELQRLIQRRSTRRKIDISKLNQFIIDRYYQKRSVGSIGEVFESGRRKSLLVLATGTGKTRVSIALVDLLQRLNWVKRVLFLADRVSLVNQAANAFKKFLPDSSPVNLATEKDKEGRVYVCTYPTMMGLIDSAKNGEAVFSVGHFDLIIIDEAHRSIYQKYRSIFAYFDSLLVGLTATPREEVDRNTYDLFDLEPGVPTDAYELERAVLDGYLVRPRVEQVDMKFPRQGVRYDDLSEEEKAHWESLDWGDREEGEQVNAAAVNKWLFNADTVDKMLQTLMERGHKVAGGDRLGKTIIFARNHDHAVFIEARFNHHYPHLKGHFARVIDNRCSFPQTLIDEFSIAEKAPHIAISVDMLDTGIDVPEVVNLVFFKPVYSKIKFWQMIGRGTRLCKDLFGPGEDKQDFRVFDFCFNFDFFRENPEGITGNMSEPLGVRLFKRRIAVIARLQQDPTLSHGGGLAASVKGHLKAEVAGMNHDNFLVRQHLRQVEEFQQAEAWEGMMAKDALFGLQEQIAGLPSAMPMDQLEARMFDLTVLQLQLALVDGMAGSYESDRRKVVELASELEEKTAIPAVKACLAYLQAVQETAFWQGMHLDLLEELRLKMRDLIQFTDKKKRGNVYSDFTDTVEGIRIQDVVVVPPMTGPQYEKKVRDYLKSHLDHIAIGKLRQHHPLTPSDLYELEAMLVQIGEEHGKTLLDSVLQNTESPSLVYFVRKIVGMDRAAANSFFADFLQTKNLTTAQIRFIETLIDQLTAQGVVNADALYLPPFSDLHAGGPDELFAGKDSVIEGIFSRLEFLMPDRAMG